MQSPLAHIMRMFATSEEHLARANAIVNSVPSSSGLTANELAGHALAIAAAQTGGDLDILNFALTLEHFEDALYRALIASNLLTGKALDYATAYGAQEHAHVVALTDTITKLGGTPVQELDKYNFPALATEADAVNIITTVEDVGASAYLGAAPLVQNGDLLTVAVQIHTVEAEHATVWRFVAGQDPVPFAFAMPRTGAQVLEIVTPFLLSPREYLPIVIK